MKYSRCSRVATDDQKTTTGWPVMAELPDTASFAAATKHISHEAAAQAVSCGPSADLHREAVRRYVQAGYDHIILVQVGPNQEDFLDFFERRLAPTLRVAS
jgi:hypothetical protein